VLVNKDYHILHCAKIAWWLHMLFDRYNCGSNVDPVWDGGPWSRSGKENLGANTLAKTCTCLLTTDQRFRLLQRYFRSTSCSTHSRREQCSWWKRPRHDRSYEHPTDCVDSQPVKPRNQYIQPHPAKYDSTACLGRIGSVASLRRTFNHNTVDITSTYWETYNKRWDPLTGDLVAQRLEW